MARRFRDSGIGIFDQRAKQLLDRTDDESPTWYTVSSDTTINSGDAVIVDISGGDVTITMPTSPEIGDRVTIIMGVAPVLETVNVNSGTDLLDGGSGVQAIGSDGGVDFQWLGPDSTTGWISQYWG